MELEMFFDYACPFCLRGYDILMDLLPEFPDIHVVWHPCEAHPRPETHGLHSDLCARGMYIADAQNADLHGYHTCMYRAALKEKINIEDPHALGKQAADLLDAEAFVQALSGSAFTDRLLENNTLAWDTYHFPAVPSFRMNGKSLKSLPGIGVTKGMLKRFLKAR